MRAFDVAVIGAGPAGSSCAISLARLGYSVALLDKEQFPREKLCGDFLNPISLPVLRALGVEREVVASARQKITGFLISSAAGDEAESALPLSREEPFGLGLSRSQLDHTLLRRAEFQGATVIQGCRVRSLQREASGWRVSLNHGGAASLRARLLIGADGRHSWVAHRLGLARGAAMRGRAAAFQIRLRCRGGFADRVEIHLFPGGYAGLLGLGDGIVNLCLAVETNRLAGASPFARLCESRLPLNPRLKSVLNRSEAVGAPRSTYPVYFPSRRSYGDAVLLVGDAARVNEPVSGEGVYFALKSGILAARAIDGALRAGDLSARRLREYETACRRAFRLRRAVNAAVRTLIYRPALAAPLIRWSARRRRLLDSLVRTICLPDAAG